MLTKFAKPSLLKSILPSSSRAFSSVDTVAPQTKEKTIRDLRTTQYKPINKLEFDKEDKCLLYFYRPRFYSYAIMYGRYLLPMFYLGKLIAANPWAITFPVALPLMVCAEVYFMKKLYEQRKTLRNVIGEIYLLRDGETLEMIHQGRLWRQIKSDVTANFYYIPTLKSPERDEQTQPLKGDLFPEDYPFDDLRPAGWAWKKFFRNPRNFFIIPKNANYKNMEILTAVFSGKVIDTSKANVVDIDYNAKEKYLYV